MLGAAADAVEVAVEEAGVALGAEEDECVCEGFKEWGDWVLLWLDWVNRGISRLLTSSIWPGCCGWVSYRFPWLHGLLTESWFMTNV